MVLVIREPIPAAEVIVVIIHNICWDCPHVVIVTDGVEKQWAMCHKSTVKQGIRKVQPVPVHAGGLNWLLQRVPVL
jgi:hypothetical protein